MPVPVCWIVVVWEFKSGYLASAEGDDAADRIVGRNADGHAIAGHHLDSEAAHPAAQLRKHLVALVALHAIKTAAVDRHDGALHINQIVLAQALSFPIKDCATFTRVGSNLSRNLQVSSRLLRPAPPSSRVIVACQRHRRPEASLRPGRVAGRFQVGGGSVEPVEPDRDDRHASREAIIPTPGWNRMISPCVGPLAFRKDQDRVAARRRAPPM